jgi:hypothetical protein
VEKILQRIVDFYNKRHQPKMAWQHVEDNIQIDSFRRRVVEKRIKQKNYTEAKKLIQDYIDAHQDKYYSETWDDYLLQIARGEKMFPPYAAFLSHSSKIILINSITTSINRPLALGNGMRNLKSCYGITKLKKISGVIPPPIFWPPRERWKGWWNISGNTFP